MAPESSVWTDEDVIGRAVHGQANSVDVAREAENAIMRDIRERDVGAFRLPLDSLS